MCHEATMNPIEVVKQRMQMHGSTFRSPWQCFTQTLVKEGGFAFYRSFPNQMVMSFPYVTHL
jgi:solute carrier family 25 iron transporter 28/37